MTVRSSLAGSVSYGTAMFTDSWSVQSLCFCFSLHWRWELESLPVCATGLCPHGLQKTLLSLIAVGRRQASLLLLPAASRVVLGAWSWKELHKCRFSVGTNFISWTTGITLTHLPHYTEPWASMDLDDFWSFTFLTLDSPLFPGHIVFPFLSSFVCFKNWFWWNCIWLLFGVGNILHYSVYRSLVQGVQNILCIPWTPDISYLVFFP